MGTSHTALPRLLASCGVALSLFALPACDSKQAPNAVNFTTPSGPAEHTYTVRGRIARLPLPPRQALVVHHEPIPEFVNRAGEKVGMHEMEMDFGWIGRGVAFDGLHEGDPVELTFEVRWRSEPPMLVTGIRKLPPGTALRLGEAAGEGGK